jgi:hypothetical protein
VADTKDPMLVATPDATRELFNRLSSVSAGFSAEQVVGAAANLLINAIRQSQGTRQSAEVRFDEVFGQMKQILVNHYDSTGRKRGIFPYPQVIELAHFKNKPGV